MNKRIMSVVMSVLLTVVAILFLQNEKVVDAADNLVLLEKKHPGYWEYLRPEVGKKVPMVPGFEKVSINKITKDNLLTNCIWGNYFGVDISKTDNHLHFNGTPEQDIWVGISDIGFISEGTFFVSIGNDLPPKDTEIFIEGFRKGVPTRLVDLSTGHFFYVEDREYDFYKFTVGVKAGNYIDLDIIPVVYKVSDENVLEEKHEILVWNDVPINLSESDLGLIQKGMNYYNRDYVLVINEKNQIWKFDKNEHVLAKTDELGRILN